MLKDDAFEETKYRFTIDEVIDARLNKQKPAGYFCKDFSSTKQFIGNDSLAEKMTAFFHSHKVSFDTSAHIVLVINQLNIAEDRAKDYDDFIIKMGLDYYKVTGEKAQLFYQQFTVFKGGVKTSKAKAVNRVFSDAMTASFAEFRDQLKNFPPMSDAQYSLNELRKLGTSKPAQIVNDSNIKDGLYFSMRGLYLNDPSVYTKYRLADTTALNRTAVAFNSTNYYMRTACAIVRGGHIYVYTYRYFYKEAFIDSAGHLFFPDVTRANISSGASAGSAAVGILGALASAFIPGGGSIAGAAAKGATVGLATGTAKAAIRKNGTTVTTSDVYIDYETGNLVTKDP